MRRIPPPFPVLVLAILTAAGAASAQTTRTQPRASEPSRTTSSRLRTLTLNVKDNGGAPVARAVALVGESSADPADSQGAIRIELRPPLRLPMLVDVQAPGFRPRQILIDGFERGTMDVYLEKAETGAPRGGDRTVSVGELSQQKQAASQRLSDAAVKALGEGDNAKAEALLRTALEEGPSSSTIYVNLGVAILRQGRLEESVAFFEKGFHLAPYSPIAAGNLGLVRWIQGRRQECYELFDRAVALGFESPMVRYYLGVLALGRGYYKQSVEELGSVDPKRFRYRDLYLSVALRGVGQVKLAVKTFQEFLQHNPVEVLGFDSRPAPAIADGTEEAAASAVGDLQPFVRPPAARR